MNPNCSEFRSRELRHIVEGGAAAFHRAPASTCCDECERWYRRQRILVEGLRDMASQAAPAELADGLDRALRQPREEVVAHRVRATLFGLERLCAPQELERRLEDELGSPSLAALRSLDRQRAPTVLERLVSEELLVPARPADTGAPRLRPAGRLPASQRGPRRARRWAGLVSLAAAAAVVWLAVRRPEVTESFDFQVVYADSASELGPVARAVLDGLSGGRVSALEGGG